MPAIAYPSALPGPSQWQGVVRERRAASSMPGNTQLRARSRDAIQDIDAAWFYTAAEMSTWRIWYESTLLDGMLWFAATAPGAGGFVQRVLRFRTKSLRQELLGNGVYRVTAQLEQRGLGAAPRASDILFLDNFNGVADTVLSAHTPDEAPAGFGWAVSVDSPPYLSGGGSATASLADGFADASGGGAILLTLTRPFAMEMTATPYAIELSEQAYFQLSVVSPANYLRLDLGTSDEGDFLAGFSGSGGGGRRTYSVSPGAHTLRIVFLADDTATLFVDGVEQESFAYLPIATADDVRLGISAGGTGQCSISRVLVEGLGA